MKNPSTTRRLFRSAALTLGTLAAATAVYVVVPTLAHTSAPHAFDHPDAYLAAMHLGLDRAVEGPGYGAQLAQQAVATIGAVSAGYTSDLRYAVGSPWPLDAETVDSLRTPRAGTLAALTRRCQVGILLTKLNVTQAVAGVEPQEALRYLRNGDSGHPTWRPRSPQLIERYVDLIDDGARAAVEDRRPLAWWRAPSITDIQAPDQRGQLMGEYPELQAKCAVDVSGFKTMAASVEDLDPGHTLGGWPLLQSRVPFVLTTQGLPDAKVVVVTNDVGLPGLRLEYVAANETEARLTYGSLAKRFATHGQLVGAGRIDVGVEHLSRFEEHALQDGDVSVVRRMDGPKNSVTVTWTFGAPRLAGEALMEWSRTHGAEAMDKAKEARVRSQSSAPAQHSEIADAVMSRDNSQRPSRERP